MAVRSLAIKYRPHSFDDVVEQGSIKCILTQQLETNSTKNAYLFCGGAGTGKTTCARIFANEINHHQGNPIEMDAASNSSVEDVREIITQAKTKSLDSEYKVFIIDECHAISPTGWQAFLKLIEEPPAKSVFIFCTTDPQKIPKTILSRVQRYDFQRISFKGIVSRLNYILATEGSISVFPGAVEYLAKIADGGMRDAITMMDKCLAFSNDLSVENIVKALGTVDYDTMFTLTDCILQKQSDMVIELIETIHMSGKDLGQFIKSYTNFMLDLCKYGIVRSFEYVDIPNTYSDKLCRYSSSAYTEFADILDMLVKLNSDIKWETAPKSVIESRFLLRCLEVTK